MLTLSISAELYRYTSSLNILLLPPTRHVVADHNKDKAMHTLGCKEDL